VILYSTVLDAELLRLLKKFEQLNPLWENGGGSGISATLSNGYRAIVTRSYDRDKQCPYIIIKLSDEHEAHLFDRNYYADGEISVNLVPVRSRDIESYTYIDSWLLKQIIVAIEREQTEEAARLLEAQRKREDKIKHFFDS
jgi:hypothetical protein